MPPNVSLRTGGKRELSPGNPHPLLVPGHSALTAKRNDVGDHENIASYLSCNTIAFLQCKDQERPCVLEYPKG